MASDLKKERDELQQELYRATENVKGLEETLKSVRALSDDRAQKLNAVESTSYKLREELARQTEKASVYREFAGKHATKIDALQSDIDNLRTSYDDLLDRYNVREADFIRVQKQLEKEKNRADQNYATNQDERSSIVKQRGVIFALESQVRSLKATIETLQRRNPSHDATWEEIAQREKKLKCDAFKRIDELDIENEELKKGIYRNGGCAGCNYWETRHKQLEESDQRKTKLIAEMTSQINNLENLSEQWKQYYNNCKQSLELWKKKHSDLMQNSQVAFAQVNDLQANVESLQKRFDNEHFNLNRAHEAIANTQHHRDIWRNSFGKSETARKALLDKVIELETEIDRLSKFEPFEQEELKELEQLRISNIELQDKLKCSESNRNLLIESNENYTEDNRKLRNKYDKIVEGIEKLCDDNKVRNRYE